MKLFSLFLVTCVEFKFENYSAFLLNYTLNVTLVLSGQPQSESFDVLIIAKNTLFASCEFHYFVCKIEIDCAFKLQLFLETTLLHFHLDQTLVWLLEFPC